MTQANLHGVWAKWERAVEQLAALDKEVVAFCAPQPYPYGIRSYSDRDGGHYRVLSRDDRLEGGTYVLEVTVPPGTHVDVEPQQPSDITFGEPHPIVLELKRMGQLIIYGALLPSADLFPDLRGVGFPGHDLPSSR